jgi:hypothetical protein
MGVNIIERTAPASNGSLIDTGSLFVVSAIGAGSETAPTLCHDIADFEAAFSVRSSGTAQATWDYLDVFFREGGNQAYVLDYATAGETDAATALALIPASLGPGQVAVVGESPGAPLYGAIQAHADANNRIGLLDVASSDNTAALMATEGALAQALTSKENVGLFGSWVTVPAPAGLVAGTPRTVPASAVIAALCNRVDQQIGANGIANYNQPAGGRSFPLQYGNGFVFDPMTSADQTTIKAAGCNFFHDAWGVLENYSFVTPLYAGSPITTTPFWQLNCSRARMWLKAQSQIVGEAYYMKDIDGQGKLAAQLGADLSNLCYKLWQAGGLFGDTSADAYNVKVGVTVNNNGTAATGTLNAEVDARFSQYADTVNITLVSVPLAGSVS